MDDETTEAIKRRTEAEDALAQLHLGFKYIKGDNVVQSNEEVEK
ncbi:hypothetical protein [Candidatus Nitrosacidococcus tergens]|uniref:Uncharacterized protein n=1 Tax=Candidatus Nitrosacidococcus tergens TaxID=553981 RepID=A0A7G1Q8E1_9GAMM|nr:hypothetical protein [Candidatus Nitrosacidococcus tergens]CAB1274972.1 protein of unknown function [Candidatus Nitrosacidococcus tergens]